MINLRPRLIYGEMVGILENLNIVILRNSYTLCR